MRWIAVSVAALIVGLLAYGVASQGTSTTIDQALADGKRVDAPDSTLNRLGESGTAKLADYKGKVVLVNFWASWCDPCRAEAPLVERTHKAMSEHGGMVLGIDTRDASEDASRFIQKFGLTYPSLRDGSGDFSDAYGITGYPETFVLDRDGKIAAARRGPITQEWVDEHVTPLLDEPA
jgi:cytochrome c biogenesis protein CcmG, thiol:disulfide interchange protein DsbE